MAGSNPACMLARAKLAQHVATLRASSRLEKAGALIKTGYLGSPKTVIRNAFGNTAFGGFENLFTRPTAVALDYIQSVARSAATGGDIKPHEFRTLANTFEPEGFRQGWKGFREGTAQATSLLRTGIDAEQMAQRFEYQPTTFKNPVLQRIVDGVRNVTQAGDKPFFNFALQTSLYGRAKLLGIREGLNGDALGARTNALLASPTEEMMLGAISDAEYATFRNETSAGEYLQAGRRRLQQRASEGKIGASLAGFAADVVLPFTKTPSAILNAGFDYTPGGVFKAISKGVKGEAGEALKQAARAGSGSALMWAGYVLAEQGNISGMRPASSKDRSQNDVKNQPANSVKIGDRWYSLTSLGPLAIPLIVGANLHGMGAEGIGEQVLDGGMSVVKTTTEQSYLQGLSNVLDGLNDPQGRGASAIAGLIPIPSLVGQAASAIDPIQRQAGGAGERLQSKTPFASRSLVPRLTQFGDTAKRSDGGLVGAAQSFLDITNSRPDRSDVVTKEMDRLGVAVNSFGKVIRIDDQKIKRTPRQYADILAEFGPLKRDALEEEINSQDYQNATEEERVERLKEVLSDLQRVGNDVDKERRLGIPTPRVTLKTYLQGTY